MAKQDMQLPEGPALNWDGEDEGQGLDSIVTYARTLAAEAHRWYVSEKRRKRISAKLLRFFAILLTAFAGIIPILTDVWVDINGDPVIDPALASVFLAIAGTLVLYDRFFGLSTGWIRYTQSMMEIREALYTFDLNISKAKLLPAGAVLQGSGERPAANPTSNSASNSASRAETVLAECRTLVDGVSKAIREETNRWDAEFRDALKRVEAEAAMAKDREMKRAKAGGEGTRPADTPGGSGPAETGPG